MTHSVLGGTDGADGARVCVRGELAYLAVRGLREGDGTEVAAAAREVERRLADLPQVRWAAVNSFLGQAVIAAGGDPADEATVRAAAEVVERAEQELGLKGPLPEHPLATGAVRRAGWSLALQLAAVPVATAARISRLTPVPAPVASLIGLVDTQLPLRRQMERVVGTRNTGVVLAGLSAAAQAGAGGLLGLGVDAVRHALRIAELDAQRAAWTAEESRLTGTAERARAVGESTGAREVPLRDGPIERYARRAGWVAGAAFAGTLAVTRRPRRAAGAILAAVPKAPWLAREAFAATLSRGLARHGIVVADGGMLRRLDRIGTAVLDTEALTTGAYVLSDLIALDRDTATGDLAAVAHRLFDVAEPNRTRTDGNWTLGPAGELAPDPDDGLARAGGRLRAAGARQVLLLTRADRPAAAIGVAPEVHEAAGGLVTAAHRAGLTVLATGPHTDHAAFGETDPLPSGPPGPQLTDFVRTLQRDGTGVLLLSRDRGALAAADAGVGLTGGDGAPPWGAQVYVGTDPARAVLLIEACGAARSAAQRGVRLAQVSAGLGSAVALAGRAQRPAGRSLLAVNATAALAMALAIWSAEQVLRRPAPPSSAVRHPWHAMTPETVLAKTGSTPQGLTAKQVRGRSQAWDDGPQHPSLGRAFIQEMTNPLTPVLGGGAALSASVGAVLDAGIIVAVAALSGLIGGTQRYVADRAIARMHQGTALPAKAVRDGAEAEIAARELVVGDVISLGTGDVVPADCRLLEAPGLETDESALTGESLPVAKSVAPVLSPDLVGRTSMVYEGTTVSAGHARAVVVATGTATEAGRGALAGRGAAPPVGVERRLAQLTGSALPVALGSAAALMAAGLLRGRPARETVGAGVGLAVASVPEGLPFLVSAAQLAAARRLSAQGVLVRDPRTIEAAGRADVLCFDKTGTLTHGKLSLTAVSAGGTTRATDRLKSAQRAVLAAGLRATPRPRGSFGLAHVTDSAVVDGAREAGVGRTVSAPRWRRTASLPFEPSRSFHATRGRCGEELMLSVKGAPEEIVERCATREGRPLDRAAREEILSEGEKLAAEGHRVLAVAELRGAAGGKLTDEAVAGLDFLGFLALADQVRGSVAEPIRRLGDAGVQILMITGDHPQTAEAIARELGVVNGHKVVTGGDIDSLDDTALDALLPGVGVVARGTPAHKVRVVQAFQRLGRTVAMTGDGANDAPAIRMADVGIALGGHGTPAARAAADLIVTDDRLETILAVLVEGRAMWASVRQALAILVGGNYGEIAFTVLGAALTGISPLTPRQLLLVNLFTDLAPAITIAVRRPRAKAAASLLREGPEASLGSALTDETTVRALATALGAMAGWLAARGTGRRARARTVALAALVASQLGQTLLVGGRDRAVLAASLGSMAALAAVIQTPGLSHFFGCTPLGPVAWALALTAAALATAASPVLSPLAVRLRNWQPRSSSAAATRA